MMKCGPFKKSIFCMEFSMQINSCIAHEQNHAHGSNQSLKMKLTTLIKKLPYLEGIGDIIEEYQLDELIFVKSTT